MQRLTTTLLAAVFVAGCSSATKSTAPALTTPSPIGSVTTTPPIQLRPVSSETPGACSEPPLTVTGPGTACDLTGASEFALGAPDGQLTVTRASVATEFKGVVTGQPIILVQLDRGSTATFARVTGQSVGKRLAFLVNGKVVMAPQITEPITDGQLALTPDPSALKQLETTLKAH
jgi:hypothetical protein